MRRLDGPTTANDAAAPLDVSTTVMLPEDVGVNVAVADVVEFTVTPENVPPGDVKRALALVQSVFVPVSVTGVGTP